MMEPVSFRATDIINLFMIDKLVVFFSRTLRSVNLPNAQSSTTTMSCIILPKAI